ncbi:MAG TPA: AmmeMemoRadiSam system protein B [bacterium]|nr:AmmeMemoRadiSam system protein B [bacterium]
MLVFSAFTPHTPMLAPTVGRANLVSLKKTTEALEKLAEEIALANPEIILIISEHGQIMEQAFTINGSQNFQANFKKFGDLETLLKFAGDPIFSYQLKEHSETKIPLHLVDQQDLDRGASVPLIYLTKYLKNIKIIPLTHCGLDNKKHFFFGNHLNELIQKTPKRIAVIATGDLSHTLTPNSPAGFSEAGKTFDNIIIETLKNKNVTPLVDLDESLEKSAVECGLKPLLILMGILNDYNYTAEILSYEFPFGVGYLTVHFELNK